MSDPALTQGYRLNNPFNLEDEGIAWKGIAARHGPYLQFETAMLGLRAGFLDLVNAQRLHRRATIRAIITAYAPSSENDTAAYIANVSGWVGVNADEPIDLTNLGMLQKFGCAVMHEEIGGVPYDQATIAQAASLALAATHPAIS